MRKRFSSTVFAALSALALSACVTTAIETGSGGRQSVVPELRPDQQVEITFESYNLQQAGPWTDTITGLISEFTAAHPNIKVTAQKPQSTGSGTATAASVQTQLLAGKAPDIAQLTFDTLDFAVNQLRAKPLDDLVGAAAVRAHFAGQHPYHPRTVTLGDWDGKTYGIPYVLSTPVLYFNSTALEKAGLPSDVDLSTWSKVADVVRKVTASSGKPALSISCAVKGGGWCMQALLRSAGGGVLSADRKTVEFGSPASISAVAMLRDLYDSGVLANQDTSTQYEAFAKGDTAIHLQTSAMQGTFVKGSGAGGWTLRAAPMPAFDGHAAVPTNSGSALFVFSEDPAKQRAAWEFIEFMTSNHAYTQIAKKIGYLPLRTSLTTDPGALRDWADGNPLLAPNLAQLDRIQPWTSFPGTSYAQIDTVLATAVEDAVFYGKDVTTTMTAAQQRAQGLIQ